MPADTPNPVTFAPITTERLLIRPPKHSDLDALFTRRNHPEVAALQSWSLPYDRSRAEGLIEAVCAMSGPGDGEWWMLTIESSVTGDIVGDLALHQSWEGRSMEIGYTLDRTWWGRGLATEAVRALLGRLFDSDRLARAHAMLHPDNIASARVLEHNGFRYEGRTRSSYWVGEVNTDDVLYGLTRSDWERWSERPTTPPTSVELVALEAHDIDALLEIETHWTDERAGGGIDAVLADIARSAIGGQVATAGSSTAGGSTLRPRGIVADGELVGLFIEPTASSPAPRLIIDRLHRGRGIEARVSAAA